MLPLLNPTSIAVVGASESPGSFGERTMRYLKDLGFRGTVYAVNPSYQRVSGFECYQSVSELPGPVDCAIIGLSRARMPGLLTALGEKGCRFAVVMGAGYSEAGAEGAEAEAALLEEARRAGIRVLGPNTTGAVNVGQGIALGSSSLMSHPSLRAGSTGLVCQSGSLAASIGDQLLSAGLGLSYMLGIGNAIDLTASELVAALADDPATTTIVAVIEGVGDPDAFARAAFRVASAGKRLIVVKAGRSAAGSRIAASHSGSIVGSWEAFRSVAQRSGAVVVESVTTAIDVARLLASGFAPDNASRVHVATMSGSLSGLIADEADRVGLPIIDPPVDGSLRATLRDLGYSEPLNPLDYGQVPRSDRGREALRDVWSAILGDTSTSALVVAASITHHLPYMAELLGELGTSSRIPIVGYASEGILMDDFVRRVSESGIVVFRDLRRAIEAIDVIRRWPGPRDPARIDDDPVVPVGAEDALARMVERPTEANTARFLAAFGLNFPSGFVVRGQDDVHDVDIELPAVLKVSSTAVTHKANAGLVFLPLETRQSLADAFETCRARAEAAGVWEDEALIQELVDVRSGIELICATRDDPEAGLVLVIGLGGSFAEVFDTVTVVPLPNSREECGKFLETSDLVGSLDRALSGIGLHARLVAPLMALADAARHARKRVAELEVNPLVLWRDGTHIALDAVAVLADPPTIETIGHDNRGDAA